MNDLYTNFNTSTNKRATTQTRVTQTHSLTLTHTHATHINQGQQYHVINTLIPDPLSPLRSYASRRMRYTHNTQMPLIVVFIFLLNFTFICYCVKAFSSCSEMKFFTRFSFRFTFHRLAFGYWIFTLLVFTILVCGSSVNFIWTMTQPPTFAMPFHILTLTLVN